MCFLEAEGRGSSNFFVLRNFLEVGLLKFLKYHLQNSLLKVETYIACSSFQKSPVNKYRISQNTDLSISN